MARIYTQEEKKYLFMQQVVNQLSIRQTRDHFAAEFPDRPIPSFSTVQRVVADFQNRGTIDGHNEAPQNVRPPRTVTEEVQTQICATVEIEPHTNSRAIAREVGVSQKSVLKVLRTNKYKPYKIRRGQILVANDRERRFQMSMYLIDEQERDNHFLENVLFTDECFFTWTVREMSKCIGHGPGKILTVVPIGSQYPQKLNVWCGILGNRVIGPFFIEGNFTAAAYIDLITNQIRPAIIAAVGRERAAQVIWQQDGSPVHTARIVRTYLDNTFVRWIGKFSTFLEWGPRSPCLTPLDFFLWGYVKSKLYQFDRIENLRDLRGRIENIIANISPEVLLKVTTTETEARLRCCIAAEGDIFEYQYR